jgi:ribosomal protein S12 methylthiotransferase accessory factor
MQATELQEHLGKEAELLRERGREDRYSDRVVCATETVARMRPQFARFGITRLADVTGLDRIGIPVWMAIRPNSKTLAVSQGKGLNEPAAQASAVMEAAELATAERFPVPVHLGSMRELIESGAQVNPLSNLVLRGRSLLGPAEEIAWVEGCDLLKNGTVFVPAEAVSLNSERHPKACRYWQSSDGLASGNILIEAVVHALCERVERDATVLWLFRSDREVADACLDPGSLADEGVNGLTERIDRSGFQLRLFDIGSDVGIPVMFAVIAPKLDGFEEHWKHFDLSSGIGCHPSPARAAIRAITEAAQSRVTSITGARDDFDPNLYGTQLRADLTGYLRASPAGNRKLPQEVARDPSDNLQHILGRLRAVGVGSVIVVPFDTGVPGFAVAKVLVPELEHPAGDRQQRYGRRAVKAMMGGAA